MTNPRPETRPCFIVMLVLAGAALCAGSPQLGGYLPPVNEPVCVPNTRYTTVQQFRTTTAFQPFTVANTQTQFAQALATATMAVTTTMQRVRQMQVQVPVTRTFEATATQFSTRVQQVPFQPPDVTRAVTSTAIRVQTSVNQRFVTNTQTSVRAVQITQTRFNTQFITSNVLRTQQQTRVQTERNVERTVVRTQTVQRTQQVPQPAFTSVIQSQVVRTSQFVQFQTPRPVISTQVDRRNVVRTQFQNVVRTQQAVATQQVVRTQAVTVTSTQVQTVTSTQVRDQVVVRTSIFNRFVTSTQVIPQVITSTRIVNRVNTQFVTNTITREVVQTQTRRGQDDVRTQVVTSFQNSVVFQTQFAQAAPVTVVQTYTEPCQLQSGSSNQGGYNYNPPRTQFNLRG